MSGKNWAKNFFYAWLLMWPFGGRKVFLTEFSHYTGAFTEYGTLFFYWSDFLFLAALGAAFLSPSGFRRTRGMWQSSYLFRKIISAGLFLTLWMFLGIVQNSTYGILILFKVWQWLKLGGVVFLCAFILERKSVQVKSKFLKIMMAGGGVQSILAIFQFISQGNLFTYPLLRKLLGESELAFGAPGVAKVVSHGEKLIRAYGTFPHPNILGGFLVLSLWASFFLYLQHKKLNKSRNRGLWWSFASPFFWVSAFFLQFLALTLSFSRSAWLGALLSVFLFIILKIVSRETIEDNGGVPENVSRETIAFPSFSSSCLNIIIRVILNLFQHLWKTLQRSGFYSKKALFVSRSLKNVSRETIGKQFKQNRELILAISLLGVIILGRFDLFFSRTFQDIEGINSITLNSASQSFSDRNFFQNVSRETISQYPLWGSGAGTSIFQYKEVLGEEVIKFEPWQFQPVHNIYYLVAAELGLVGLFIYLWIIFEILKLNLMKIVSRETIADKGNASENVSRETMGGEKALRMVLTVVLSAFLLIGFWDHYLYSFWPGQIMLGLVLGVLVTEFHNPQNRD